jgi:capsular exopolysaccharide synthesis family protein
VTRPRDAFPQSPYIMMRSSIFGPLQAIPIDDDRLGLPDENRVPRFACGLDGELAEPKNFALPAGPEERLVSINDQGSFGAELLRTLAARLRQVQKRHPVKKLLVTSAVPGEGKTLISANLSITLAQNQKRVLLIDGDLRSSSLSRWFDIVDDSFLSSWCDEGTHRLPLLRKAERLPLWVVPAGKPVEMPGNILQSSEFADALGAIEPDFDWIVIDSPPLVPFSDAGILASLSDAVVLVTRKGVTPKKALRDALKSIDNSKIIATILNGADVPSHKYYREYYTHVGGILPAPGGTTGSNPRTLNPK